MEEYLIKKIEAITFTKIKPDEQLWASGILDSINIIELAVELENELKIQIPFDEIIIENFQTISSLAEYVRKKQNNV